jgi:hypothetical protein
MSIATVANTFKTNETLSNENLSKQFPEFFFFPDGRKRRIGALRRQSIREYKDYVTRGIPALLVIQKKRYFYPRKKQSSLPYTKSFLLASRRHTGLLRATRGARDTHLLRYATTLHLKIEKNVILGDEELGFYCFSFVDNELELCIEYDSPTAITRKHYAELCVHRAELCKSLGYKLIVYTWKQLDNLKFEDFTRDTQI